MEPQFSIRKYPNQTPTGSLAAHLAILVCFSARSLTLRKTKSFALCVAIILGLGAAAKAGNITVGGNFAADDNVQLFSVTVGAPAMVDIRSYGYAGGTTSTGESTPSGGFDTILTLFNGTGRFLVDNDDGAGVAVDATTGLGSDARITAMLTPGNYFVALTQYDNFSIGNLTDGFAETGNPNFTADSTFTTGGSCPANTFRDISGTSGRCRNGDWTVDFVNVANVTPVATVPEAATSVLLAVGLIGLCLIRGKRRTGLFLALLVPSIFAGQAGAQDRDYSTVGDILNGKRRLLAVEDLVVSGYVSNGYPYLPDFLTFSLNSSNSQLSAGASVDIGGVPAIPSNPIPTVTGHIFQQSAATTVVLRPDQPGECTLYLPLQPNAPCDPGDNYDQVPVAGATADFNQDSYDEIAVAGQVNGQNSLVIASAANVNDSYDIPIFNYGPALATDPLAQIVVGDFNGDGLPEIAGLLPLPAGGLALEIFAVNPTTLAITKAAQITLQKAGTGSMAGFALATGRFSPQAHDQIIVASTQTGVTSSVLELIDFGTNSLTPAEQTTFSFPNGLTSSGGVLKVKIGRFGLTTNTLQQVAFMFASTGNPNPSGTDKFISVLSIDPNTFVWTAGKTYSFADQDCGFDIAVGNFDHREPDPTNPGKTQPNFNDQIALLYGSCSNGPRSSRIIDVDPSSFTPTTTSTITLDPQMNPAVALSFSQSDTQGRSMILGNPTKVTITTLDQPTVIAAVPPMHVDFVKPLDGSPDGNTAQVMDLSGIPETFFTQYEVENMNTSQSSHTGTTAQGWSTKEAVNTTLQFGNPETDPASTSVDAGFAASQAKHEIDTTGNNTFTSQSFDVSVQTNGYDQVWYTENDFNVWIYPIQGKTTCAASQSPNCSQVPLNIQFSAPSPQVLASRAGNILSWYQPPWESGNIFSYPANFQQLQAEIPVPLKSLSETTSFSTDSLVETIKANWTDQSGNDSSTDSTRTYTEEGSLTESGKVSLFGVFSEQQSVSVTAGGSQSFGQLDTSETKLGASTGIGIHKPGGFANPGLYNYPVAPYILGNADNNQPVTGTVNTHGTIRAVFTADPSQAGSGNWWQNMYGKDADVALNHPYRWVTSNASIPGNGAIPRNCRVDGDFLSCYSPSPKTLSDPTSDEFHWMRGLFITDATNPGQGPQVEVANVGDTLSLQARVYNYSLAAMDSNALVHVRFYVQPWSGATGTTIGNSVRIGDNDIILDPIPPFSGATGAPLNWVFASTTFDTTPYANQYLIFWIVVWMQDRVSGQLIPDLEGHGLTSIPGTITSIADIQEEAFSNNIGIYNSKIYVKGPTGSATLATNNVPTDITFATDTGLVPAAASPLPARTAVGVGKVSVSGPASVAPGPAVKVSAILQAGPVDADTTTVFFYDGNPNAGGKEFAGERVPFIPAQGVYTVTAPYRAHACGVHSLFVVANQGTASEVIRRAAPVRIPCASE